jgi:hypothetical protein
MAWIESHQTLRNHPKISRFAKTLKINKAQAIGHLHLLWWWTLDYSPKGDLSAFTSCEICGAAEWQGDEDGFVSALRDAGWLEKDGKLHDWSDYGGKCFKARERQRRYRKNVMSPLRHRNVTVTPTVHNSTVHNRTTTAASPPSPPAQKDNSPTGNNGKDYEIKTPIQFVVSAFKLCRGVELNDREWDRDNYSRASKSAKELLAIFNSDQERAAQCVEAIAKWAEKNKLDWTIETAVKRASDWKIGALK